MRSLFVLQLAPTKLAANYRVAESERRSEEYSALLCQKCTILVPDGRLADSERVPEEYSVFYGHKPALPCDKASKDPALSCAEKIDLVAVSALPVYFLTSKNKD